MKQQDHETDEEFKQRAMSEMTRGFFPRLLRGILKELIVMAIVFGVATGISAAVCLYYGLPLILSLIGGFLSIGAVFFIKSDSIFD
jgi:hypothetical protein